LLSNSLNRGIQFRPEFLGLFDVSVAGGAVKFDLSIDTTRRAAEVSRCRSREMTGFGARPSSLRAPATVR
jgi:hypothetical protein